MSRFLFTLFGLAFLFSPTPSYAHSFGKLYTLPVPFWMYLYGGAAAIALSFLIIGYFFNKTSDNITYPKFDLSKFTFFRILSKSRFQVTLQVISLFLFFLTVLTGLIGYDFAGFNFNMTFFWIIFVLGLTYLTALIGNVYSFLNPFKILAKVYEKVFKTRLNGLFKYPKSLSYYPALVLYFAFIWVELFAETTPRSLSFYILGYLLVTFFGVVSFGKETWFKYGEFFSVFFRLIGKIAPVELKENKFYLRPPFVGVLKEKADHFSLLIFIMFMLASTAYDGFHSTVAAYNLYYPNVHLLMTPIFGDYSYKAFQILTLIEAPFIFLAAYVVLLALAKKITKSTTSLTEIALQFAFSLIPIALAYNLAHYYTLILTEGQNIVYLISDPFGFNWNLFNTAHFKPNLSVIDAATTWNMQVAFILVGHIAGVYLAHLVALKVFPTHKIALLSQVPLLILMVLYTMTGLWILAQPVIIFN